MQKLIKNVEALIINSFVSKYYLFNSCQRYRGHRIVFVTQNDPSLVIFTKTLGELFLDSIFIMYRQLVK